MPTHPTPPGPWSQPHPVNDHVAGAAAELRRRGHEVVVLAPSGRATDLAAGRRALKQLGRRGTPLENVVAELPSASTEPLEANAPASANDAEPAPSPTPQQEPANEL